VGLIAKGSFVAHVEHGTLGVVSEIPNTSGFFHVYWLTEWDETNQELHYFQEFISDKELLHIESSRRHSGLEALRRFINR
jgi:hypothetical protein